MDGMRAGSRGIAGCNGIEDGAMLLPYFVHEGLTPRFVGARDPDPLAQVLLQKPQQQTELGIAGAFTDGAVKCQVLVDAIPTGSHCKVDRLEHTTQRGDLGTGCALRGKRSNLAFEHAPHLDHMHEGLYRFQHLRIEGQRLVQRRGDNEYAGALARQQQVA